VKMENWNYSTRKHQFHYKKVNTQAIARNDQCCVWHPAAPNRVWNTEKEQSTNG